MTKQIKVLIHKIYGWGYLLTNQISFSENQTVRTITKVQILNELAKQTQIL